MDERVDDSALSGSGTPGSTSGHHEERGASISEGLVFADARVFKTGNSLAIRIPSAVAKSLGIEDGSPIDMAVQNEMIWVRRSARRSLGDLIARITPENTHAEQFDILTEREAW